MPIKNYTTAVPVMKTAAEIDVMLSLHGARRVMKEFSDEGEVEAISFTVRTGRGETGFRLPVNVNGVLSVLERDRAPKRDRKQAERIAWRIVKDWVAAQMAIIEAEMASMEEIFFPYMITKANKTLYEAYLNEQLKLTE